MFNLKSCCSLFGNKNNKNYKKNDDLIKILYNIR